MASKKNGLIQELSPSGQVMKETEYVDGKKHGIQTCYDPDGNPNKITNYENNIRIYEEIFYKGKIVSKTAYLNGKKEGKCETFEQGIKVRETNYANGKKDGEETTYFPNGKVESAIQYTNGKKGDYTLYHQNGNLSITEKAGIRTDYDKAGIPVTQSGFENDIYFVKQYYRNGQLGESRIGNTETYYDPAGNQISQDEFWAAECHRQVGYQGRESSHKFTQEMYIAKRDAEAKKRLHDYNEELRDFGQAFTKLLKITPTAEQRNALIPKACTPQTTINQPIGLANVEPITPRTLEQIMDEQKKLRQTRSITSTEAFKQAEPKKVGFFSRLLAKFG